MDNDKASDAEMAELWARCKSGDGSARERILVLNMPMVGLVAGRVRTRRRMEFDDMVSVGYLGLIRAVDKFDPGLGKKFSTYAAIWIRSMIQAEVSVRGNVGQIPKDAHDKAAKAFGVVRAARAGGRDMTIDEAMDACGLSDGDRSRVMAVEADRGRSRTISEWFNPRRGTDWSVYDLPDAAPDPDQDVDGIDEAEHVASCLDDRSRAVVFRHLGIEGPPTSQARLAAEFGMSPDDVHLAYSAAILKMRAWHGVDPEADSVAGPKLMLTHEGRTMSVNRWAAEVGIHKETIRWRIRKGWDHSAALTKAPGFFGKGARRKQEVA